MIVRGLICSWKSDTNYQNSNWGEFAGFGCSVVNLSFTQIEESKRLSKFYLKTTKEK